MPQMLQSTETKIAHVFTSEERKEFFECLNKLKIKRKNKRFLEECRVIFRLYYCCGLRLSEPLWLTWDDIDCDSGRITILQSKGYKDRVVWVTPDVAEMIRKYNEYISAECPDEVLVFPGTKNSESLFSEDSGDDILRCDQQSTDDKVVSSHICGGQTQRMDGKRRKYRR